MACQQGELLLQRQRSQHDQRHAPGAVVAVVEGGEAPGQAGRVVAQRAAVAGMAAAGRMPFVTEPAECRQPVQVGVGQPGAELRVEHCYLVGDALVGQAWRGEHVHQPCQTLVGVGGRQVQVDIGNAFVGAGVVASAPFTHPARELAGIGKRHEPWKSMCSSRWARPRQSSGSSR